MPSSERFEQRVALEALSAIVERGVQIRLTVRADDAASPGAGDEAEALAPPHRAA